MTSPVTPSMDPLTRSCEGGRLAKDRQQSVNDWAFSISEATKISPYTESTTKVKEKPASPYPQEPARSRDMLQPLSTWTHQDLRANAILKLLQSSGADNAPNFSDGKDENVAHFLADLERVFVRYNVPADDHHTRIAVAYRLTGWEVRREVTQWTGRETRDYPAFAEKLEASYLHGERCRYEPDRQILAQYDVLGGLYRLHQVRQEASLELYILDFNDTLQQVSSWRKPSVETQVTLFFAGLEDSVRESVRSAAAHTLAGRKRGKSWNNLAFLQRFGGKAPVEDFLTLKEVQLLAVATSSLSRVTPRSEQQSGAKRRQTRGVAKLQEWLHLHLIY